MNLTFLSTKDEIPKHNSQIVFINCRNDYVFESFEFQFGEVEYFWDNSNGASICYDENDPGLPEPDNEKYPYKLMVLIDGQDFGIYAGNGNKGDKQNKIDIFWAYYDDIFNKINEASNSKINN